MATQVPISSGPEDVRIELITDANDFEPAYDPIRNAFGRQTADGIWIAMNPGWGTALGKSKNAALLADRWRSTKDAGNAFFLKATVPDGRIVGLAIWVQSSLVDGYGEPPPPLDFSALYPDDERQQRFCHQLIGSMQRLRREILEERAKPDSAQKSVFILDLCAVDPEFQGQGIAKSLVQWGLDEADRRGGLEAITEASRMGRRVYGKLGFTEVQEIKYVVDEEFGERELPSNVFMRTRP
ncbi:acyl-CoA N-acyltransferase [Xylariales sp. AK1849]|nr:acyl-CoA N-acyltransferase [Xylariales sp. AK1849]